jgi:acetylornithine deacetylase/succinyl-diaminopimelate desuccinylase-like protein
VSIEAALGRISAERSAALTLDLVSVASPTGDTAAVSELFARVLGELGLEVELFREFPATPVVIGRLRGQGGGPTLILNGHLDTVPVPHAAPERRDGRVYGRGAADMKGPIAAAVEAVCALRESGTALAGDVVLCAHGLHEAPGGHAEDLARALEVGAIRGDAAIVLELGHDALPVVQMGMGIFRAEFFRPGSVTHEIQTPAGTPNPVFAAAEAALSIEALNGQLAESTHVEHVGPETAFLGQLHSGDFYNRFPARAWLEGTRRYSPEKSAPEMRKELGALFAEIAERRGVELEFDFACVREGCRISEAHPLVSALRSGYTAETGRELPIIGSRVVADASVFQKVGGIPCLYHGLAGEGAHGDVESISEAELFRAARVYARTTAAYVGLAG